MPPIREVLSEIDRAIVDLRLAMRQERLTLETRPAKPRNHPKGHIAPVYTVLTPKEIRQPRRLSTPWGAGVPAPLPRRALRRGAARQAPVDRSHLGRPLRGRDRRPSLPPVGPPERVQVTVYG
ncbi:MAG: hypothetical protein GX134_03980 [candidate division WS1 bacterium]|jgi:hypothetical protein|nr:hypothetical protein [candidate division WS1 bacterium]